MDIVEYIFCYYLEVKISISSYEHDVAYNEMQDSMWVGERELLEQLIQQWHQHVVLKSINASHYPAWLYSLYTVQCSVDVYFPERFPHSRKPDTRSNTLIYSAFIDISVWKACEMGFITPPFVVPLWNRMTLLWIYEWTSFVFQNNSSLIDHLQHLLSTC